jgi:hypothetical protein
LETMSWYAEGLVVVLVVELVVEGRGELEACE